MKMFLTRFGMRSRMVVCGDPKQIDLSPQVGAVRRGRPARGHRQDRDDPLRPRDVVRHPLVGRIVEAYEGTGQ